MIHVCRVDIGCRYIFDMSDGIDDVYKLKLAIEKDYSIALNDQIMLISGGCLLNNIKQKLYGLCAGIEESPIYLIDRKLASSPQLNITSYSSSSSEFGYLINQSTIDDINKRILESIKLQASYQTVQLRTQLAQQCYEYSQQMHKLCESTYLDQYWQYQGFMALIANLDDNLIAFEKTYNNCKQQFQRYSDNKDSYKSKINEIENYLHLLSKIRLLPEIVQDDVSSATSNNRYLFNSSIYSTAGGSQSQLNVTGGAGAVVTSPSASSIVSSPPNSSYLLATSPSSPPPHQQQSSSSAVAQSPPQSQLTATLLEWTNSLDPRHKLDIIIERARDILANVDTNWWLNLDKRIEIIMKDADNRQMKEIEGLTKRLADLNNFLDICKTCVSRQKEIAESFKANQMRATTLRDDTILIDLCMGHERQLEMLKENHQQMVDITKKIIKAKLELVRVINSRLNWVMNIQTTIGGEINKNLYMQTQTIKQLDRIMKQVEQLKNAPNVYLISLHEMIRREKFSSVYKKFLNDMYSLMNEINKFESQKRDNFKQKVQFSYVSSLFPCLNEQLVSKQTDFLCKFDQNLPKLSENDVKLIENDVNEYLKESNLAKFEDNEPVKTTSSDDLEEKNRFNMKLIEKLSEKIENELNKWKMDRENRAKEACKADTATTMVAQASDSTLFLSTLTDDTQLINDEEQMVLVNKKPLANEQFLKDLNTKIQQELAELRSINNKNRQIDDCLKQFLLELEQFKHQLCVQVEKINEKKSNFYSYLIENLFNNENQQDQSPSSATSNDTPTPTTTDLFADGLDESFYNKLKDNLLKLRELYEIKLDNVRRQHEQTKTNYMADRQKQFNDALNKLISDKDKQINELKDELNKIKFNLNNTQLREQLLLDKVSSMEKQLLPSQSTILSTSPTTTAAAINTSNSVSVITSSTTTGNINNNNNNSGSSSTLSSTVKSSSNRSIELCTCTVNDLVLVVYDSRYDAYKIINQTSPYIHFVHTDSLKLFELINNPSVINSISNTTTSSPAINNESIIQDATSTSLLHASESTCEVTQLSSTPTNEEQQQPTITATNQQYQPTNRACDYLYSFIGNAATNCCSSSDHNNSTCNEKYVKPFWFVGTVLSKEFCVAKKEANRYHVPSGTRFYRVKIKPYKL